MAAAAAGAAARGASAGLMLVLLLLLPAKTERFGSPNDVIITFGVVFLRVLAAGIRMFYVCLVGLKVFRHDLAPECPT